MFRHVKFALVRFLHTITFIHYPTGSSQLQGFVCNWRHISDKIDGIYLWKILVGAKSMNLFFLTFYHRYYTCTRTHHIVLALLAECICARFSIVPFQVNAISCSCKVTVRVTILTSRINYLYYEWFHLISFPFSLVFQ